MKLQNEIQLDIPVSEMKDGQIGVLTQWGKSEDVIGRIVQRYDSTIISLQKSYGFSWYPIPSADDCRVRILQKGEILIIE